MKIKHSMFLLFVLVAACNSMEQTDTTDNNSDDLTDTNDDTSYETDTTPPGTESESDSPINTDTIIAIDTSDTNQDTASIDTELDTASDTDDIADTSSGLRPMEYLNRSLVVQERNEGGTYLTWRILGTDPREPVTQESR